VRAVLSRAPLVARCALFRQGLVVWFVRDDFAGLLIATQTHTFTGLLTWTQASVLLNEMLSGGQR
jgi:hypothetical protein